MTKIPFGRAVALPLLLFAVPAQASESESHDHDHLRPDGYAPSGVMFDHVHKAGDVMIGLT